jgi:GAF domain-containing protein
LVEGGNRTFLWELRRELLIGVVAALVLLAVGAAFTLGLLGVAIVAAFAIVVAFAPGLYRRFRDWRAARLERKVAPFIIQEQISYMTHLRDVGKAYGRARTDPPDEVRGRIRREVLEPIRGFMTTPPGCEIKVVWFRPDSDGRHLHMYEQVGHSDEGEQALRLQVGASAAGKAFVGGETFYSGDCEHDATFQKVDKGKASGTLVCIPIGQGDQVTGVLSVLANWVDAFWVSDISYLEALASAMGALEQLEEGGNSAGTSK